MESNINIYNVYELPMDCAAISEAETGLGMTGSVCSAGDTFSPSSKPLPPVVGSSCVGRPSHDENPARGSIASGARKPPRRRRGACERSSLRSSSVRVPSALSEAPVHPGGLGKSQSSATLGADLEEGMISKRLVLPNGKNRLACEDVRDVEDMSSDRRLYAELSDNDVVVVGPSGRVAGSSSAES